jgi:hypothetical protein
MQNTRICGQLFANTNPTPFEKTPHWGVFSCLCFYTTILSLEAF